MKDSADSDHPHLPYRDRKPTGAADFYFAIHATFRFIREELGPEALRQYWSDLGQNYLAPVHRKWREGGSGAIADYWRDFFSAEPEADVAVEDRGPDGVALEVRRCPAIHHLRRSRRTLIPEFCQHCYFISQAAAQQAGYEVRVQGGNGSCQQCFIPQSLNPAPQDLNDITPNSET